MFSVLDNVPDYVREIEGQNCGSEHTVHSQMVYGAPFAEGNHLVDGSMKRQKTQDIVDFSFHGEVNGWMCLSNFRGGDRQLNGMIARFECVINKTSIKVQFTGDVFRLGQI